MPNLVQRNHSVSSLVLYSKPLEKDSKYTVVLAEPCSRRTLPWTTKFQITLTPQTSHAVLAELCSIANLFWSSNLCSGFLHSFHGQNFFTMVLGFECSNYVQLFFMLLNGVQQSHTFSILRLVLNSPFRLVKLFVHSADQAYPECLQWSPSQGLVRPDPAQLR